MASRNNQNHTNEDFSLHVGVPMVSRGQRFFPSDVQLLMRFLARKNQYSGDNHGVPKVPRVPENVDDHDIFMEMDLRSHNSLNLPMETKFTVGHVCYFYFYARVEPGLNAEEMQHLTVIEANAGFWVRTSFPVTVTVKKGGMAIGTKARFFYHLGTQQNTTATEYAPIGQPQISIRSRADLVDDDRAKMVEELDL